MASNDFSSIKFPLKFDGLNFLTWKVKMTLFLKSLRCGVAKIVSKEFIEPKVMRILGPKSLPRNMRPISKPNMHLYKHSIMMTYHGLSIVNSHIRFGMI